MCKQRIY